MFNNYYLLPLLLLLSGNLQAQIRIEGRLLHANTLTEISGVNIFLPGTSIGTTSAPDGHFSLILAEFRRADTLFFQHIAFDTLRLEVEDAARQSIFYLQPGIIRTNRIVVTAHQDAPGVARDLPQSYTVIKSERFEIQGYIDAGDLLRTEQSVQVDEELSGKKTITIRNGNSDDVIVLFNGVKMNNAYDNIFDLSLINLEDVEQVEVIKGSNTSLYGPDAFSGVVNIVPKSDKNYLVKFQQKIGTYASGDWNLQLNHSFADRLDISYSIKRGGLKRYFENALNKQDYLENSVQYQTASLRYRLFPAEQERPGEFYSFYMRSGLGYEDHRFEESTENGNEIINLGYEGNIGSLPFFNLSGSRQNAYSRYRVQIGSGIFRRETESGTNYLNLEKRWSIPLFDLLTAYQFEKSRLHFNDLRINTNEIPTGVESANLIRNKNGLVGILKFHMLASSGFYKQADFDCSLRFDQVSDRYSDVKERVTPVGIVDRPELLPGQTWSDVTYKIATHLTGFNRSLGMNSYINVGTSIKFPSMFQQISVPSALNPYSGFDATLLPEKNNSTELGLEFTGETRQLRLVDGWDMRFNYFKNYYDHKFRMYYLPGIPMAFYENIPSAEISGVEIKAGIFLIGRKLKMESGGSFNHVSEKAAFPFKSKIKYVNNVLVEHAGYTLQLHWFLESEQTGWVRGLNSNSYETSLPGYSDLDIHLSKRLTLGKIKFFVNVSGRNLLDNKVLLSGLALRDRRYYLTIGAQY